MPNWCDNRLALAGPPVAVKELVKLVEGADQPFDFERLLPTPRDLLDGADYTAPGIPEEFPGWYAWRREHWGVKWNAGCGRRQGYGRTGRVRYRFLTPYGPPVEFLDHLAACYPTISMWLSFDVELLGDGHAAWREGRRVEHEEHVPL